MINAIVCVDENWGVGYQNQLLAHIPEDLKRFKELTTNGGVIMGRVTWDSLPKKPLPDRTNLVITHKPDECPRMENTAFGTMEEITSFIKIYSRHMPQAELVGLEYPQLWVIGGAFTYWQLLPYCDTVYLTKIHKAFENVDTYFPKLDQEEWEVIEESEVKEYNGLEYQFITYKKLDFSKKI